MLFGWVINLAGVRTWLSPMCTGWLCASCAIVRDLWVWLGGLWRIVIVLGCILCLARYVWGLGEVVYWLCVLGRMGFAF